MGRDLTDAWVMENCPPESGGQRGRFATTRGVVPQAVTLTIGDLATTSELRASPPFSLWLRSVGLAFAPAHDSRVESSRVPIPGLIHHVA